MSLFSSKFWVGMMVGSVVGAMAYRCAQSDKAKLWRNEMCKKWREMRGMAGDVGAKMAEGIASKAEEAKDKAQSLAHDMRR